MNNPSYETFIRICQGCVININVTSPLSQTLLSSPLYPLSRSFSLCSTTHFLSSVIYAYFPYFSFFLSQFCHPLIILLSLLSSILHDLFQPHPDAYAGAYEVWIIPLLCLPTSSSPLSKRIPSHLFHCSLLSSIPAFLHSFSVDVSFPLWCPLSLSFLTSAISISPLLSFLCR